MFGVWVLGFVMCNGRLDACNSFDMTPIDMAASQNRVIIKTRIEVSLIWGQPQMVVATFFLIAPFPTTASKKLQVRLLIATWEVGV